MSKSSTNSFYQSFSFLLTNHLEIHSPRCMFLRKNRSCEYWHCRCLARIVIALNRRSVFGQIQYTKPPEHLCLLNKLLQLILVRVLTRSWYMIGVILIFRSVCQKNTFALYLHYVCLLLIHASIQANTLRITAQQIRNLRTPASAEMSKRGSYSRRPLPSLPNPPPFFPSSLSPLDAL